MRFSVGKAVIYKPQKPLPSLKAQAANLAQSIKRNAISVAHGAALKAPEEEIERRREVCAGCEFFRPQDQRCAHPQCGCYLRAKTWLKAESCPAGKW